MGIDHLQMPSAQTVDLTGLPEPVAQDIRKLVQTLRERLSTADISPGAERTPLRGRSTDPAASVPQTVIAGVQQNSHDSFPKFISRPQLTPAELERLLDEFSEGPPGKILPPDFSRADIYDDHD